MKYKYTFTRADKTITVQMTYTTMFVYNRYLNLGYAISKREVLINGSWVDVEELKRIVNLEIF